MTQRLCCIFHTDIAFEKHQTVVCPSTLLPLLNMPPDSDLIKVGLSTPQFSSIKVRPDCQHRCLESDVIIYGYRQSLDYAHLVCAMMEAEANYITRRLQEEELAMRMLLDARDEVCGRLKSVQHQLGSIQDEFWEQEMHPHDSMQSTSTIGPQLEDPVYSHRMSRGFDISRPPSQSSLIEALQV